MRHATPLLFMAVLIALPCAISAQEEPQAEPRSMCFGGADPECVSFWITEAAVTWRTSSVPDDAVSYGEPRAIMPSVELGGMRRLGSGLGLGASMGLGLMNGLYVTAKPRLRWWPSTDTSLEVAPGLVLGGVGDGSKPSLLVDATLMYRDQIGLTAQVMRLQTEQCTFGPSGSCGTIEPTRLYLGARAGSKVGAGAAAVGVTGLLVSTVVVLVLLAQGGFS